MRYFWLTLSLLFAAVFWMAPAQSAQLEGAAGCCCEQGCDMGTHQCDHDRTQQSDAGCGDQCQCDAFCPAGGHGISLLSQPQSHVVKIASGYFFHLTFFFSTYRLDLPDKPPRAIV